MNHEPFIEIDNPRTRWWDAPINTTHIRHTGVRFRFHPLAHWNKVWFFISSFNRNGSFKIMVQIPFSQCFSKLPLRDHVLFTWRQNFDHNCSLWTICCFQKSTVPKGEWTQRRTFLQERTSPWGSRKHSPLGINFCLEKISEKLALFVNI